MNCLIALDEVALDLQSRCNDLIDWGILAAFQSHDKTWFSRRQFDRLIEIGAFDGAVGRGSQLFPSEIELCLNSNVSIIQSKGCEVGEEVLLQVLPSLVNFDNFDEPNNGSDLVEIPGTNKKVFSPNKALIQALLDQRARINSSRGGRTGALARSAHYMGSKLALAPLMGEIIRQYLPPDGAILDLMCGSGAASSYFSREWATYASDAQHFSRLLALVQGGGVNVSRAKAVLEKVLDVAREHFINLERCFSDDVAFEENFLSSEISETLANAYTKWVREFPRVSAAIPATYGWLQKELESKKINPASQPYVLFCSYYANLFFGIRQAIEIDSLRFGIAQLTDPLEREWALGALICAVSACADNHGGHFAQPRVKIDDPEDILLKLPKTLFRRSMSVFQEFSARLLALAEESCDVRYPVTMIDGPWEHAVAEASKEIGQKPALVYLDPPYTREEYSRYYHVLETLVLYNYPEVSGRALVPEKRSPNRFSSTFFSRNPKAVEKVISEILLSCLEKGWSILWSYADSGLADVIEIISSVDHRCQYIETFSTNFSHSGQGRKGKREVKEYFIYLSPRCLQ